MGRHEVRRRKWFTDSERDLLERSRPGRLQALPPEDLHVAVLRARNLAQKYREMAARLRLLRGAETAGAVSAGRKARIFERLHDRFRDRLDSS